MRHKLLCYVVLVLLSGGLYLVTLAPTVTSEDSGELIASAFTFGIPHPPGYPLWTILSGLFIKCVPIGQVAYRVNLFSALCGALSTIPLFAALRLQGYRRTVCLSASGLWACSGTLWSQSVIAEVYSLHALLVTTLLWSVVCWHRSKNNRWLIVSSGILGLGMCNQHTMGFVGLGLGAWVVTRSPQVLKNAKLLAFCAMAFAIALAPYLYLPIRASADPVMNWGNPSSADALWDHVSRAQYGATAPVPVTEPRTIARLLGQVAYVIGVITEDLTWPITLLGIVGLCIQLWRRDSTGTLVLWLILCCGLLFLLISNIGIDRTMRHAMRVFLIPLSLTICLPLAFLLDASVTWVGRRGRSISSGLTFIVLAAPVLPIYANFHRCNYSNYWYAYDHAQNILRSLMPNAILFPSSDHNTFPLLYVTLVEGARPDVTIADKYGYTDPSVMEAIDRGSAQRFRNRTDRDKREWVIRNARRPVYVTTRTAPPVENASFQPVGLVYHLLPTGRTLDRDGVWNVIHFRNDDHKTVPNDLGAHHVLGDREFFLALDLLRRRNVASALKHFDNCAQHLHGIKEAMNNIGSALGDHGLAREAQPYFRRAIALDARYLSPRRNLAHTLRSIKDWDALESLLEDMIGITPDDFRLYEELGRIQHDVRRRPDLAIHWWRQSLQYNPNQPELHASMQRLTQSD